MSDDDKGDKKIIIDDDWKSQVEKEKEDLSTEEGENPQQGDQLPEANFLNHIASLATQTMVMLGLVEHPAIGKRVYDGDQARFLIDTITMLKEKTKGNLSKEEEEYLERVVPELQMTYVEVSKAVAQAQAEDIAKATGQDGVGINVSGSE